MQSSDGIPDIVSKIIPDKGYEGSNMEIPMVYKMEALKRSQGGQIWIPDECSLGITKKGSDGIRDKYSDGI
jgi:hypothetical protein